MRGVKRKLLFILFVGSLLSSVSAWSGAHKQPNWNSTQASDPNKGTKVEEIVKWEDLSDQYVLGYGIESDSGKIVPFAIYDKTFFSPFYSHFWKVLILASIGVSDLNLAHLSQKVAQGQSPFDPSDEWNKDPGGIRLAGDFWKNRKILWKKGRAPFLNSSQPKRVRFQDLDWERMGREQPELSQALRALAESSQVLNQHQNEVPLRLESVFENAANEKVDSLKWAENMEFLLQKDGTYQLFRSNMDEFMICPVKIIDLKKKESSFQKSAIWASITNIIKGGLNAVPAYGPPQLAGAVLERVFDFLETLYLLRHSQALNLVMEALENNPHSPFRSPRLSREHLKDAAFYLLRTDLQLSAVFANLAAKKETSVIRYAEKINDLKSKGEENLRDRGISFFPIPQSYFALGLKRDKQNHLKKLKIYALSYPKLARKKPHAAVDFLNPKRERTLRIIQQSILLASNFIYVPVPGIATVIKMIYKEIFIREIEKRQMWESGLLAHIHHAPYELTQMLVQHVGIPEPVAERLEKQAIIQLEDRRLNPLDLKGEEIPVYQKRVENWIRYRDPTYQTAY